MQVTSQNGYEPLERVSSHLVAAFEAVIRLCRHRGSRSALNSDLFGEEAIEHAKGLSLRGLSGLFRRGERE